MALDKSQIYTSTQINPSPTITGEAGANMDDVRCKGVKFDENGKIVLAGIAGEPIIGVGIITNNAAVRAGEDVDIQVKDIGCVLTGADVKAGAELAVDADGAFQEAAAGQFVAAIAVQPGKAGQIIRAQMVKYCKASA